MSNVIRGSIRSRRRGGFTLVEAVISTVIVSVMLVAALSTVGASRLIQQKVSLNGRGRLLAESLLAEIVQQAYEDPDETVLFGPESGEATNSRSDFDDVDDYHNWSQSPPKDKSGSAILESGGWTRTVTVDWVDATDPALVETSETNVKRVTVNVFHEGRRMATFVRVMSGWQLIAQARASSEETAAAAAAPAASTSSLETTSTVPELPASTEKVKRVK
jgi:MSHA pilin protein MshD